MIKQLLACSALAALLISCNTKDEKEETKEDILFSSLDTTVRPSDDFFEYANGGWIKKNPIPNEQSSWGIGNLVFEENLRRTREISEEAAKSGAAKGSNEQKIGDFWSSGMDSVKIENDGLKHLQPYLDKVNAITDIKSLLAIVSEFRKLGSYTVFADFVTQDDKNSEVMTYKLWQGGIGLPEREYYFKADSATKNIRNEYVKYIATMLHMAGDDSLTANNAATDILAMETKLAQASRKLADLRDPYANYNKMAITDLGKMSASIDWNNFLTTEGVKNIDSVIVGQPEFFKALETILKSTPINVWKSYVRFNLISDFAGSLPDRFGVTAFNFNRLFSGAKERRPRWKRVMQSEENAMGELLGQLYVKKYFNETAKKRYIDLVEAIRDALRERIKNLSWMSDSTKEKAYTKLAAVTKKVGYPDKWKDFSAMTISNDSYLQNIINANIWQHDYEFNKLGKPVDRTEWGMTPQTWNAYYNPSNNEIVLPAGIFTVPGFQDEELDDALVYGYAGASTIGHEITHGFDDEGRQYDSKGNLVSWWTTKDEEEFKKRAETIIKQFNEYEPLPGYHINGKATTGENIADLGGILIGLDAFKKTQTYKEGKLINGMTPIQRYFLGYALSWQFHFREESLRNRLVTDVHSPAKYRVNGPFVDVDDFYTAFNIKAGDKMYRPDSLRARIW
jgi:putative endopeptidase